MELPLGTIEPREFTTRIERISRVKLDPEGARALHFGATSSCAR
jgi:hypothetical protein